MRRRAKRVVHAVSAGVLKGRTRLLITNQLQYLPQCDHICFMLKVCCGCMVSCSWEARSAIPRDASTGHCAEAIVWRAVTGFAVAGPCGCAGQLPGCAAPPCGGRAAGRVQQLGWLGACWPPRVHLVRRRRR